MVSVTSNRDDFLRRLSQFDDASKDKFMASCQQMERNLAEYFGRKTHKITATSPQKLLDTALDNTDEDPFESLYDPEKGLDHFYGTLREREFDMARARWRLFSELPQYSVVRSMGQHIAASHLFLNGHFRSITVLNLRYIRDKTRFVEFLPIEIGLFCNLEELDVRDNILSSLPYSLKNCLKLRRIWASDNYGITSVPKELTERDSLRVLDLRRTQSRDHTKLPFYERWIRELRDEESSSELGNKLSKATDELYSKVDDLRDLMKSIFHLD